MVFIMKNRPLLLLIFLAMATTVASVFLVFSNVDANQVTSYEDEDDGSIKTITINGKRTQIVIESSTGDIIHQEAYAMEQRSNTELLAEKIIIIIILILWATVFVCIFGTLLRYRLKGARH